MLTRCHRRLLDAARTIRGADLDRPARGHRQTPRELLVGIAFHDVYHAGQVRALRKLAE
jgi:uncharacterized damage-inducible protein DinB